MKKEQSIALKTMAIKARVANKIRTELYKEKLDKISTEEKIKFFDLIFQMNYDAHNELVAYKWKRQQKAEIERLRKINLEKGK